MFFSEGALKGVPLFNLLPIDVYKHSKRSKVCSVYDLKNTSWHKYGLLVKIHPPAISVVNTLGAELALLIPPEVPINLLLY